LRASQSGAAQDLDDSPPRAGDLVGQVKKQLASDHRNLGKFAAALMSVQSNVDKTEESMLGKVLDLQTARTFFTRHEAIDTANDKMQDDVNKLNTQVEGLSSTVYKVQKAFLAAGTKNREEEGKLHDQSVENAALIESINAELAKGNDVKEQLKKLTKIHDDLLAQAVEALKAGKLSLKMLNEARDTSKREVGKHRSLRNQLVQMNNYSIACHAKVEKTSKELGQALLRDSKDNQAAILTMKQKQKATQATEQRLLAERALLVSETKKVEDEEVQEMDRLKDLREDFATLEKNIVAEVRDMQAKINSEKERLKSMRTALMENTQAQQDDLAKKQLTDELVAELSNKLHDNENPVIIATTEGQNDALQAELNEAYTLWKSVKAAETAALLNLEQAQADVEAQKQNGKLVTDALKLARKEGQQKLAQAVKVASESKAKSAIMIEKAEAAVAGKCKPKWDKIRKKQQKKLKKCRALRAELMVESSKKDLLMTAVKARAEAR
jgi:hypothetical protein